MSGLVEFDRVWLDDRRRCTWGICELSFVAEPGTTTALIVPPGQGAADAVFELLTGRRVPVHGHVVVDGVDLREAGPGRLRSLTIELRVGTGERRLTIGGRTVIVAEPSTATLDVAAEVLEFDAGFLRPIEVSAAAG